MPVSARALPLPPAQARGAGASRDARLWHVKKGKARKLEEPASSMTSFNGYPIQGLLPETK